MLRACGLVGFRRGRSLFLWPAWLRAQIRVWYGFLWGTPRKFILFLRRVPLKIHTRPEGSGMDFEGDPYAIKKGLIQNLGGPHTIFFILFRGSP